MLKKILVGLAAIVALLVIGAWALLFRSDLEREELSQYINEESEFIELPMGANMHFRDQGNMNGPVIVLLHGGYGSLQNWEYWTPWLQDDYRMISMDLPAHGLTGRTASDRYTRQDMVQSVGELLNELGVDSFTMAGHSMGGGVALQYALTYPEQVNAMILVGPEGIPPEGGYDLEGVFFEDQLDLEGALNDKSLSITERLLGKIGSPWAVEAALQTMYADPDNVTPEVVAEFGRILRHEGNRYAITLMFRQFLATIDVEEDLAPRAHEIEQPVLLLCGMEDALVPPDVCNRAHDLLPNSELKMYEDVGHLIQMEATEQTAEDVLAFLGQR